MPPSPSEEQERDECPERHGDRSADDGAGVRAGVVIEVWGGLGSGGGGAGGGGGGGRGAGDVGGERLDDVQDTEAALVVAAGRADVGGGGGESFDDLRSAKFGELRPNQRG